MNAPEKDKPRRWAIVLGDQLWLDNPAIKQCDPDQQPTVWMAEVREESEKVWSHKTRIALFLSAMRHFRATLEDLHYTVRYTALTPASPHTTFGDQLKADILAIPEANRPQQLLVTHPGEWSVLKALESACSKLNIPLMVLEDTHFYCSLDDFRQHARARKQLRMEFFYRWMRKTHHVLMNKSEPEGQQWNFDASNRQAFPKQGLGLLLKDPIRFLPDELTRQVMETVEACFPEHPGRLEAFDWPVSAQQAEQALEDFIQHRLPLFGQYQDAMWQSETEDKPYLYHSRLSASMNLHLLDPRLVVERAEAAYREGHASLESVEGFIRQILGWREYVRGIYWLGMPSYLQNNSLNALQPLPSFYWTNETDMACLKAALGQTLTYGYAHHIQRLMVTGLFALLLGVNPKALHQWYLAVYVDAVEWVEVPNTMGMSQYADGGWMSSKPYVATGKYIQRMSNYCQGCRYHPEVKVGPEACPFTTLYWDFLNRHRTLLENNPRMSLQVRNLDKLDADTLQAIQTQAEQYKTLLV